MDWASWSTALKGIIFEKMLATKLNHIWNNNYFFMCSKGAGSRLACEQAPRLGKMKLVTPRKFADGPLLLRPVSFHFLPLQSLSRSRPYCWNTKMTFGGSFGSLSYFSHPNMEKIIISISWLLCSSHAISNSYLRHLVYFCIFPPGRFALSHFSCDQFLFIFSHCRAFLEVGHTAETPKWPLVGLLAVSPTSRTQIWKK